jgi:hypothetical protein
VGPPLAHVLDDCTSGTTGSGCSLKLLLESRHFEFVSVEWIAGWLNPYVRILARAKAFFNSKEEAAQYITDALNGIADARMAEIRIEVRQGTCPAPEPAPVMSQPAWSWACPPGYEYYDQPPRNGQPGESGCRPIKRKKRAANPFVSSYMPTDWGFDSESDYVPYEPAGPTYSSYSQSPQTASQPAPQTQLTASGDGVPQATTSPWLWLILAAVGVFAIKS